MDVKDEVSSDVELPEIVEEPPNTDEEPPKTLSKNQQRKLRAKERYLEKRVVKRAEERARRKAKREARKEAGEFELLKKKRPRKMADSTSKQRVALDMSFDNLMSEKDQKRSVRQINWCYTANRHAAQPFQLHLVGFNGPSRKIYDNVEGAENQDVFTHESKLEETFKPEEIVYLSAESDNVLETLDDTKVYVIGGLVDHNFHKGLCHNIAVEKKFGHARLPIDEYVHLKTRRVLTINQVYEILIHYSTHKDWEQAFLSIVPGRKGLLTKSEAEAQENGSDSEKEEADEKEEESKEESSP